MLSYHNSKEIDLAPQAPILRVRNARAWLERLWSSIAERGRGFAEIPAQSIAPIERARMLASALLSERGEASGAAVARELLTVVSTLAPEQLGEFYAFLAEGFQPDTARLMEVAKAYIASPSPEAAASLATCAEPPRQELLRRMNMAPGGTMALVAMRKTLPDHLAERPALKLLDGDLKHLFSSWFNRGFLEIRRIDWQTPAAILEKLIAYEAVHEIQGWDDLRRRLAADRRCFAFFHPALPGEPLIFVEVALVRGLSGSVRALLERDTDEAAQLRRAREADTAIFYSISNCQDGLRGISFGNFLIKQVVEELRAELPGVGLFSTLSPVPGFRRWLESKEVRNLNLSDEEANALFVATGIPYEPENVLATLRSVLSNESWTKMTATAHAVRPILLRLCAEYLCDGGKGKSRLDPVARFHLGNGARLERINWMGNPGKRGLQESYGIMVNYLYDPATIEANHEAFVKKGSVIRSVAIEAILAPEPADAGSPKRSLIARRGARK
jgi:malonyl-CoA decarboxylase